jgi:Domain of unknown function (DUF4377)
MRFYLICFLSLLVMSSKGQSVSDKIITIEPYMSFQNYEHFKRLTLTSPDSHIDYLKGFNFAWGYSYQLSVSESKLDETLSDGTQYEYLFHTIISKTKVPDSTQFKLLIDPNRYYNEVDSSEKEMNLTLRQLKDGLYLYFNEVEIEIPDNLKTEFHQISLGKTAVMGQFIYVNERRIRLVHL